MNKTSKYLAIALAIGSLSSCADLDTVYEGGYVNTDQKQDATTVKPDLASAGVNAIFSQAIELGTGYRSSHYAFGYPAIMLGTDLQTADFNGIFTGASWFTAWQTFGGVTNANGICTYYTWDPMYANIKCCNDVLAALDKETDEDEIKFYLGQAYAVRAFDYWILANLYQFNVQRHPDLHCVPILTEENAEDAALNGCPLSSVAEVYAQIMSDANEAIRLISESKLSPEAVSSAKAKRLVSLATAYGLRARFNMSQGKYADAASDAQAAITNFAGAPAGINDVNHPTFCDMTENNWMWGLPMSETDDCVLTGIVNWPSFICTFNEAGYVTVGAWRYISKDLFDAIPTTDVRRGWFLDENLESVNLNSAENAYIESYTDGTAPNYGEVSSAVGVYPYTNVKFACGGNVVGATSSAQDIPRMRIEEMYYILAEAQAMSGSPETGRTTLVNFIRQYRNPSYVCGANTGEEVQNEVFQQKRVELWGEGLMYYEYLRLNKPIDRRRAHAPYVVTYNIAPESDVLRYLIPEGEINANKQINPEDNNPFSTRPTMVAWEN